MVTCRTRKLPPPWCVYGPRNQLTFGGGTVVQRCGSSPLQWQPLRAPPRPLAGTERASLCQTAGIFPVPLSLFVPQLSPRCTHSPAPSSDFFQKLPPPLTSPVHPSPAGIVLRSGVKWCGGRRAGHLTVRSLPCWHDPPHIGCSSSGRDAHSYQL